MAVDVSAGGAVVRSGRGDVGDLWPRGGAEVGSIGDGYVV